MKKYFIIILAVLLLFTFTSCKDKSAEVEAEYKEKLAAQEAENESIVKNYEDFMEVQRFADDGLWMMFSSCITADCEKNITELSLSTLYNGAAKYYVTAADGETVSGNANVTAKSGTIKAENVGSEGNDNFYYNKEITFDDNEFTLSYYVKDANGTATKKTADVTLDGTFSVKVDTENKTIKIDVDVTANEKTYKASWTLDTTTLKYKYKEATVNGKEVELRLLNKVAPSWS